MINKISSFNKNSLSFGVKYANKGGKVVDVPQVAIDQAKKQAAIRTTLEKNLKNAPIDLMSNDKVYFTMFSNGKCYMTKEQAVPVCCGYASGFSNFSRVPDEITAFSLKQTSPSSDELGQVRANGSGYKFATIYPDGEVDINKEANEIFLA